MPSEEWPEGMECCAGVLWLGWDPQGDVCPFGTDTWDPTAVWDEFVPGLEVLWDCISWNKTRAAFPAAMTTFYGMG